MSSFCNARYSSGILCHDLMSVIDVQTDLLLLKSRLKIMTPAIQPENQLNQINLLKQSNSHLNGKVIPYLTHGKIAKVAEFKKNQEKALNLRQHRLIWIDEFQRLYENG